MTNFYSKILFFGEYTLIKGSKGLAVPFQKYSGTLAVDKSKQCDELFEFYKYLASSKILSEYIDLDKLQSNIEEGLYFDSSIPSGKGLGSSGAFCASLFKTYQIKEVSSRGKLQELLGIMESFYHGTSSGLDCLLSYENKPLVITGRNSVEDCNSDLGPLLDRFSIFDSGSTKKTAPLVHLFLDKFNSDEEFRKASFEISELTDYAVQCSLESDFKALDEIIPKISRLQFMHFEEMIPKHVKELWLEGLETKHYYIKLCGSGGGGFFLLWRNAQLGNTELNELWNGPEITAIS